MTVKKPRRTTRTDERAHVTEARNMAAKITLNWMEQRFNKVDSDNKAITDKLAVVHDKVNQHAVYWAFAKWIAVSLISIAGSLAAWFGFSNKPQ